MIYKLDTSELYHYVGCKVLYLIYYAFSQSIQRLAFILFLACFRLRSYEYRKFAFQFKLSSSFFKVESVYMFPRNLKLNRKEKSRLLDRDEDNDLSKRYGKLKDR